MFTFGSLFSGGGLMDHGLHRAGWRCLWQCEKDPAARRVLAARFPGVECYPDVTTLDPAALPAVAALCGGTPCFPAGTLVLCVRGLVPIEDVQAGDRVLTHQGDYRAVVRTMSRTAPVVRVTGQGHPGIVATADHPFYATAARRDWSDRKKPVRAFAEPSWVPASEMMGRFWASPTAFPELPIPPIKAVGRERVAPSLSEGFFWLVGAWLGDGWAQVTDRRGYVKFGVRHSKAGPVLSALASLGLSASKCDERAVCKIQTCGRALARWLLDNFGRYSEGKTLPAWALGMREEWRRSLLEGYLFTDGSVTPDGKRRATTVSERLALGVKLLAQSLGYSVSMYRHVPAREHVVIDGRTMSERPQWQVEIYGRARSSVVLGAHRWGLVRKVEEVSGGEQTVYDLEVEGAHSFLAGGIVVHNCQGLSVAGKRGGLADPRSGLFAHFVRVAAVVAPRWVLWENVAGALSCTQGRDFAAVLGGITGHRPEVPEEGWGNAGVCVGPLRAAAWRVLDAHATGGCALHGDFRGRGPVPQRRRRVFIVAYSGNARGLAEEESWRLHCRLARLPLAVLFDGEGLPGDLEEGGAAGPGAAAAAPGGPDGEGRGAFAEEGEGHVGYRLTEEAAALRAAAGGGSGMANVVVEGRPAVYGGAAPGERAEAAALTRSCGTRGDFDSENFVVEAPPVAATLTAGTAASPGVNPPGRRREDDMNLVVAVCGDHAHALTSVGADASEDGTGRGTPVVAVAQNQRGELRESDAAPALTVGGGKPGEGYPAVRAGAVLRRLTPTECLRLMGMPDDWLDLTPPLSDAAKYRICGLGVAANVAEWLGRRILEVDEREG